MRVQIVSFRCVLKDKFGRVISSSFNQEVTPNASEDQEDALPALTEYLKKLKVGERKKFTLTAEEAYGFYQLELLKEVPRSHFKNGKKLKVNDWVKTQVDLSIPAKNYRIIEATDKHLVIDANHPLAGQDLFFDIEMTASREEDDQEDQPIQRTFH